MFTRAQFSKALWIASGCALLTIGCASGTEEEDIIDETIENLVEAGFPEADIQIAEGKVYVGNDAEVSVEASREMLNVDDSLDGEEQYRTRNLVSRGIGTICVNGAALSGTLSTALNWAINNYNRIGLTFRMRRTSGSTSGCGAVIRMIVVGGSGGQAGFPSGGRPFGTVRIGSGVAGFGTNTAEHVITHELGHTLGLRHTDFFNRSISCNQGGNEGDGGIGAIHIPGTPTGASVGNSVMNSCFRTREDGEFRSGDITALRYLY